MKSLAYKSKDSQLLNSTVKINLNHQLTTMEVVMLMESSIGSRNTLSTIGSNQKLLSKLQKNYDISSIVCILVFKYNHYMTPLS